nr:putative protein TPRXL [Aegilops tauschii subsp. strangulata]
MALASASSTPDPSAASAAAAALAAAALASRKAAPAADGWWAWGPAAAIAWASLSTTPIGAAPSTTPVGAALSPSTTAVLTQPPSPAGAASSSSTPAEATSSPTPPTGTASGFDTEPPILWSSLADNEEDEDDDELAPWTPRPATKSSIPVAQLGLASEVDKCGGWQKVLPRGSMRRPDVAGPCMGSPSGPGLASR